MNQDTQLWRDLLHVTESELFFSKCIYHFILYIFILQNIPILDPNPIFDNILINIFTDSIPIKRLNLFISHKTLGYYKCPSGQFILKILQKK